MLLFNTNFVVITRFLTSSIVSSSKFKGKLFEILTKMPKNQSKRINDAQKQRLNLKELNEKTSPSTIYLQVIGSGAEGAPKTLYLFTDQKRYLFNCGEGTQRIAHEHKVKLSRLEHIFITSKTWKNLGGLPGVSLTLQDVGVPEITLHGPPGLDELYHATRRFIIMKDMKVSMAQCDPGNDYQDNCMSVKYVLLGPEENHFTELIQPHKKCKTSKTEHVDIADEYVHDNTDYYNHEHINRSPHYQSKNTVSKGKYADTYSKRNERVISNLKKMKECTVAYICTLQKRLGTLDLEKCVEFGVKPGPMLGLLKKGQDVMLENGKVVRSKDVKTPDDPGPVFIVIDIPDISFLKESKFKNHFDNGTNPPENIPEVVVHFTSMKVVNLERYQEFMRMFGPKTAHLLINDQNTCQGLVSVHRVQQKLNLLNDDIFPLLKDNSIPPHWTNGSSPPNEDKDLKEQIGLAHFKSILKTGTNNSAKSKLEDDLVILASRTLTMFHLRPKRGIDRSAELSLQVEDYIAEAMQVEGFPQVLHEFKEESKVCASTERYPKVVFLGTGSCIPNKTRNTSAIVLHIDESHSILMDCGEGTYGQMVRFYGKKNIGKFMDSLKGIYISHLHADHHIGLIGVLQGRQHVLSNMPAIERNNITTDKPLYLLAPGQIMTWLSVYDQEFENIRDQFNLVPNSTLTPSEDLMSSSNTVSPAILSAMGLANVVTCLVSHCPNAFGVTFTTENYEKITYSGDTIPCENLIQIGRNTNLLIHEATMEDDLADEARVKMHSTSSQAINVGREMHANFIILTHFSQRYARLPRLDENITEAGNVGVAYDNMQVSLGNTNLLTKMFMPLQLMFAEHVTELEVKAAKRARLKEKRKSVSPPNLPTADKPIEDESKSLESECDGRVASNNCFKPKATSRLLTSNTKPENMASPQNATNPKPAVHVYRAAVTSLNKSVNHGIYGKISPNPVKITFSEKSSIEKPGSAKKVTFQGRSNRVPVRESKASQLRMGAIKKKEGKS